MSHARINIPARHDLGSLLGFALEIDTVAASNELIVDFGQERFFSPFEMLFVGAKFKSLRAKYPKQKWTPKGHWDHTYLAHVGFFQLCGFDHGRDVGEAAGNDNYLPITRLERSSFYESPADKYQELPDLIQRHADKLA